MREIKITLREVDGKWQIMAIDRYHCINTPLTLNPIYILKEVLKKLNVTRIRKQKQDKNNLDETLRPIKEV